MGRAIALARLGSGWVNPNPQVGCVIVRDGTIIGEGYHHRFGQLHAEREALADCRARGNDPQGATAYVTLEPCDHTGKTPPCTDALIEAGIAEVVIGSADPNPLVSGAGAAHLRRAGIHVREGVAQTACDELNLPFFHHVTTGLPWVIAKYAMTLDGKIATRTGASQWITGVEARQRVHEDRARYGAIMVGRGTVAADDPLLTARPEGNPEPHQPLRVIVDSALNIPLDSRIVRTASEYPTLILTADADSARRSALEAQGCEVQCLPSGMGKGVDLISALALLGRRGIDSMIVEGGPTLLGSFFDTHLVNYVQAYIAPKIFGGTDARSPVAGEGVALPIQADELEDRRVIELGADILIEGPLQEESCSRES